MCCIYVSPEGLFESHLIKFTVYKVCTVPSGDAFRTIGQVLQQQPGLGEAYLEICIHRGIIVSNEVEEVSAR